MNRASLVCCELVFAACAPAQREASAPAPPPRIAFATSVHDFGAIEQGNAIAHTFAFSNRGGVDLTIDKLRSGCGCEASIDVDRVVPPGATANVRVQCDTKTSSGKQRRTVSIYSNDPVQPVTVVRLVGTVRADATLAPSTFYTGRVHRGERVRRDGFVRWPPSASAAEVVADENAAFRVDMSVSATAFDRGTFTLVINEDAPLGPIQSRLHLRNSGARRTASVVGEVVADVSVSPSRLELAATESRGGVIVENAGPRSVRISGTEWPMGTATVETLDPGKRYRIVLAAAKPGVTAESELIVRTDHPEQPLLRVPVTISSTQ